MSNGKQFSLTKFGLPDCHWVNPPPGSRVIFTSGNTRSWHCRCTFCLYKINDPWLWDLRKNGYSKCEEEKGDQEEKKERWGSQNVSRRSFFLRQKEEFVKTSADECDGPVRTLTAGQYMQWWISEQLSSEYHSIVCSQPWVAQFLENRGWSENMGKSSSSQ